MHKKMFVGVIVILIGLFLITFSVVKQSTKISVTPSQKPLIESNAINLPVSESDPFYGNPGSAMTIDEFFSFDCKECAAIHEQLVSFIDSHPGEARLRATGILKTNWLGQQDDYLPLLALFCGSKQDKYWPFLDKALKISKLDETAIKSLSQELKLNESAFDACLKDENLKIEMQNKQAILQASSLVETPLLFINNKKINLTEDIKILDILNGAIAK